MADLLGGSCSAEDVIVGMAAHLLDMRSDSGAARVRAVPVVRSEPNGSLLMDWVLGLALAIPADAVGYDGGCESQRPAVADVESPQ